MNVAVRLSSELARLAGAPRLTVELAQGATVDELRRAVEAAHPGLGGALGAALPLIRGNHVGPDHKLTAGEEIALLLPAAGG
jgi:molybdopterin converting factor small subunit